MYAMERAFLVVTLLFGAASCDEARYSLVAEGYQFKPSFITSSFVVQSNIECAMKCLEMGKKCGSFSIDKNKTCLLSFFRVPTEASATQIFEEEAAVKLYTKKVDSPPPAGDVLTLSTVDASYILVNQPVHSWYEAFDLCPLFGDGFYMAAIESEAEQNAVADWLMDGIRPSGVWLAGSDEGHENCWVLAVPGLPQIKYTAWDTNPVNPRDEPDNFNNKEHCMVMWRVSDFRWRDIGCIWSKPLPLCERPVVPYTGVPPSRNDVLNASC